MAALSRNGLNGITPTARGLLLNPNRVVGFVVQSTHAKGFALAHWLVGGADGGRLCLRCSDSAGVVRENTAGDALASGTTLQWAPTSKTWQAGAVMQDSDLIDHRPFVALRRTPAGGAESHDRVGCIGSGPEMPGGGGHRAGSRASWLSVLQSPASGGKVASRKIAFWRLSAAKPRIQISCIRAVSACHFRIDRRTSLIYVD